MWCLFLEIALLIVGIVILAIGKFTLGKGIVLQGTKARIAGGILILILPVTLGVDFLAYAVIGQGYTNYEAFVNLLILVMGLGGVYLYGSMNKPTTPPQVPPPMQPPAVPPTQ